MRCTCAGLLVLALGAAAQTPFRVQSRLVQVPVLVTDAKGRSVQGLQAEDFELLDAGEPRKLAVDSFDTGLPPISLIIALQSAGISAPVLEKVRKVGAMVHPLVAGARGCAGLLAFHERVEWLQPCTADEQEFGRALDRLRPGEFKEARMLDAVDAAVRELARRPNVRRVLLMISETKDRGSESDLESVVVSAQSNGVAVYSAVYSAFVTAFTQRQPPAMKEQTGQRRSTVGHEEPGAPPRRDRDPIITPPEQRMDILGGLEELARLGKENTSQVLAAGTGGATFRFARLKGLEEALQRLGEELREEYLLSFDPGSPPPGYRPLAIRVKRPGKYKVRARAGYWTGPAPAPPPAR